MVVGLLDSLKQGSWHVCLATAAKTFCCERFPRSEKKGEEGKVGGTDESVFPSRGLRPSCLRRERPSKRSPSG